MKYYSAKRASEILGYNPNYLRELAKQGKIACIRTAGGHRRYDVEAFIKTKSQSDAFATVCYCRVSSTKQKDDLERQVNLMRSIYPDAEIIRDIGSGLNEKRRGYRTLLDRLLAGDKLQLVIAHRDRLCRFGIGTIQFISLSNACFIKQSNVESMSSESTRLTPQRQSLGQAKRRINLAVLKSSLPRMDHPCIVI